MKRIIFNFFRLAAFAFILIAVSCEEKAQHGISVSPSSISFPASGGTQAVSIATDGAWSLNGPEWAEYSQDSGTGGAEIAVTVTKNEGLTREGTISVSGAGEAKTISIRQGGLDFMLSQYAVRFTEEGTPVQITVKSNYDWSISVPPTASWCGISPIEGKAGETVITLTPAPLTDRNPRKEEFITVNYNGIFSMITVSQDMPNEVPSAPVLEFPVDGADNVSIISEFRWQKAVDPDGDALTYSLMISSDNGETWSSTSMGNSVSGKPSYMLRKNTPYKWKVQATDAFGASSESEVNSFMTDESGAYANGEITLLQKESAGAQKPVHLVIMGDGFIEEDFVQGGAWDKAVETAVGAFFGLEPYITYRDYFRISTIAVYSQERGATVKADMAGCPAQQKNTAFSATLEGGNSTGTSCDYDKVFSYAMKVPEVTNEALQNTTVLLLINLDVYAGTCLMEYTGRSVSMCPMGKNSFEPVVMHEAGGHGFGRLIDEYRYFNSQLPSGVKDQVEYWRGNDPYYAYNISFTGDRTKVHWKNYFGLPGYSGVGVYEGGMLYNFGCWRPEYISCMEDNRPHYNAPSREAIVRRIMRASGSSFDINDFLEKDKAAVKAAVAARLAAPAPSDFVPLAPPVLINR